MDADITSFISTLVARCPDLRSIWMIGSRANASWTSTSDWDFIAMGSAESLKYLQRAQHLHRPDVDFLVVTDHDAFCSAWSKPQKCGSLSGWQWTVTSPDHAQYVQSKWVEKEDGSGVKCTKALAVKVWGNADGAA